MRIFLILFFIFNLINAEDDLKQQIEAKIFSNPNDYIIDSQQCTWECRDVKSGYATQITGFDFKNGMTYCKVFNENNLDQDLGINANRTNKACIFKPDIENEYQQIISN